MKLSSRIAARDLINDLNIFTGNSSEDLLIMLFGADLTEKS